MPTMSEPASPITFPRLPPMAAPSSPPWLVAEGDHEADDPDHEAGAERPEVEQRAAHEHQPTEDDEDERDDRRGRAEAVAQPVAEARSDAATVPAEPEDGREHEPDRKEAEPPELGMVMPARLLRALAHARGAARLARARRRCPLLPRGHGLAASAAWPRILRVSL